MVVGEGIVIGEGVVVGEGDLVVPEVALMEPIYYVIVRKIAAVKYKEGE